MAICGLFIYEFAHFYFLIFDIFNNNNNNESIKWESKEDEADTDGSPVWQVRSAVRKRFHRWQEQHSIRARMTQAMSIPTSPSRVSFHSIKQSTSIWMDGPRRPPGSATSPGTPKDSPSQASWARGARRAGAEPQEVPFERKGGQGWRTLQRWWNERLADQ